MINVILPLTMPSKRLPFYLAMEEWVAKRLPANEYFFVWQSSPTVICGRNQDIEAEVDLSFCRANGIECYRRKSGGGCVYSDMGNLMTSYVAPGGSVADNFGRYTAMLAAFLRTLGLNAAATGRNDVEIDGKKVSGCAFYRLPDRSIAHGTMLFSPNMHNMRHAITPAKAKLESKKVQSVEARITSLSQLLPQLSLPDFTRRLVSAMCDASIMLDDSQIAEIERIEAAYYRPEWISGRPSKGAASSRTVRIDGVGALRLDVALSGDTIQDLNLTGDFFLLSDLDSQLFDHIRGKTLDDLPAILSTLDTAKVIAGLSTPAFAQLLHQNLHP